MGNFFSHKYSENDYDGIGFSDNDEEFLFRKFCWEKNVELFNKIYLDIVNEYIYYGQNNIRPIMSKKTAFIKKLRENFY